MLIYIFSLHCGIREYRSVYMYASVLRQRNWSGYIWDTIIFGDIIQKFEECIYPFASGSKNFFWHVLLWICKYNVQVLEICHNFGASRVVFEWMEFLKLFLFVDMMQENCLVYISYTFLTSVKQITESLCIISVIWTNCIKYLDKVESTPEEIVIS